MSTYDKKLKKLNKLKRIQNQWKNKREEYFDSQYNITRNITNLLTPVAQVKEEIKASKEPNKLREPSNLTVTKIDAETDPRPALEYHKPRAIKEISEDGTPKYYDEGILSLPEDDFEYFSKFAKRENHGYFLKKDQFFIGNTKISLKLIDNGERVEVTTKSNKYTFYQHEFEDLFGSNQMPDFYDTINKGTFFLYYSLLKECGIGKIHGTRRNPLSEKGEFINNLREVITQKLSEEKESELLTLIYNDLSKTVTLEHGKKFIESEGKGVVILPSSVKELKRRLALILAELKAGNNSDVLKNEVSAIVDELKKKKSISSRYEKTLLLYLL